MWICSDCKDTFLIVTVMFFIFSFIKFAVLAKNDDSVTSTVDYTDIY